MTGMPTGDFTVAFWARTPAINDLRTPGANQAELFSYATHLQESGGQLFQACSEARSWVQGAISPLPQDLTRLSSIRETCVSDLWSPTAGTKAKQTFVDDAILIDKYRREYGGLR